MKVLSPAACEDWTASRHPVLIVINGLPASGKSTIADHLSLELQLPCFGKDRIKEILFDTLGSSDRSWSKSIGAASQEVLWYLADIQLGCRQSVILENNFRRDHHLERIRTLQARYDPLLIEIYCTAKRSLLLQRFRDRVESGERHPGHAEEDPTVMEGEFVSYLLDGSDESLSDLCDYALVVDTSDWSAVDLDEVSAKLRDWMRA